MYVHGACIYSVCPQYTLPVRLYILSPSIIALFFCAHGQARGSEPSTPAPERTASFELPQTTPSKPSTLPLASRTKTEGFLLKRKRSSKKSRRKKSIRDEERASKYFIVSLEIAMCSMHWMCGNPWWVEEGR